MDFTRIHQVFTGIGGEFLLPMSLFVEKLQNIKAFIFDWDGVFNDGKKGQGATSLFSEPDTMGLNLLRLGFWIKNNHTQPYLAVITGLNNESAKLMAEREHFNAVFMDFKNKRQAFDFLCEKENLQPHEIAFVFDDALDLSVAKLCGVRILIQRKASPLFLDFVKDQKFCDYVTGSSGSEYGVREACELMLGLSDLYTKVVEKRISFDDEYQAYWSERNAQKTEISIWKDDKITFS